MSIQGTEVVQYIEEHGLSLVPEVFSVIFDFLSGTNRFLQERIETVMETDQLTDENIKALYKDYIFQKQLHASIITEEEVAKTLNLIDRVHSKLEETTKALDNVQDTLEFRSKVVAEIDTHAEIEMLKDTISHDINTLLYEINDSNLWIKYRQKVIKDQLGELKSQQRVHYQDTLTNLPNKFFLKQKLSAICSVQNANHSDERIYIGKITIDNLSTLNQIHGRTIGDAVLRKLGKNIQDVIPENWELYRVDGNDFALSGPNEISMNEMSMKLITLKKTFSGKRFKSKVSEEPVVTSLSVKVITMLRATAAEDIFDEF
ncbi:diguanylate cyclase domain-containing protein [Thiomicrorhabdus indica]|uniref:diguanylate cyclase domain-containing protein n=1 Tax=Thiomicrorhabdus indica TaxID=2267253 RepID=UPI002AA78445|nr:diguanylate cyclase [Thiomicrorhabdus indica]